MDTRPSGSLSHYTGNQKLRVLPYNFSSDDEKSLSGLCSAHGYTVVKKPKEESEYHPDSHKVLIPEPGHDDERIECGCGLIAKWWRMYKARGEAGTLGRPAS